MKRSTYVVTDTLRNKRICISNVDLYWTQLYHSDIMSSLSLDESYDTNTTNFEGKNTFDLRVPCEWAHYKLHKKCLTSYNWTFKTKVMANWTWKNHNQAYFAWMLIYDTTTTNFEGKNTSDLRMPCEWAHYKLHKKCLTGCNWTFQTKVMANRTRINHNQAHLHGC